MSTVVMNMSAAIVELAESSTALLLTLAFCKNHIITVVALAADSCTSSHTLQTRTTCCARRRQHLSSRVHLLTPGLSRACPQTPAQSHPPADFHISRVHPQTLSATSDPTRVPPHSLVG